MSLPDLPDDLATEWREIEPMFEAMPAFMTIIYLFAAAIRGATLEERARLHEAQQMLKDKKPLRDVGQAILDAKGPDWAPDKEWLDAIEAINRRTT